MMRLLPLLAGVLAAWLLSVAAPAQPPSGIPGSLPTGPRQPSAPASGADMAARLATLPTGLEAWSLLGDPGAWPLEEAPARLGPAAAALDGPRFLWGASARLRAPRWEVPVTVDIMAFADPLDAFGAYTRLRGPEAAAADIGLEAQWAEPRLLVWQGRYLGLIQSGAALPADRAPILEAAQAASARLPMPERKPLLVRLMPRSRLRYQSLRYWREEAPELPMLSRALTAEYVGDVGGAFLTLSYAESPEAARSAYQRLLRRLDEAGERRPMPGFGGPAELIPSRAVGLCLALQEGPYVVAVTHITDRRLAEALLRITLTHIHVLPPDLPG